MGGGSFVEEVPDRNEVFDVNNILRPPFFSSRSAIGLSFSPLFSSRGPSFIENQGRGERRGERAGVLVFFVSRAASECDRPSPPPPTV